MTSHLEGTDVEVLKAIISSLEQLDHKDRERILQTVATFFGVEGICQRPRAVETSPQPSRSTSERPTVRFSEDLAQRPKEFLLEKQPRTDVERIACLGYYLTHYRDTPDFKTLDLSKLNTEAAQPKFTNAAQAVSNAHKMGYLVPATKGGRQLSAGGEQFVQALPDRELGKKVMANFRPRRKSKRKATSTNK